MKKSALDDDPKKIRKVSRASFSIGLVPAVSRELSRLTQITGQTDSEVVENAIIEYGHRVDVHKKGGSFYETPEPLRKLPPPY